MGHIDKPTFHKILEKCKRKQDRPRVYIETGVNTGNQIAVAMEVFELCYGVELSSYFYYKAVQRTGLSTITLGDSRNFVKKMAEEITEPCFWVLDAHYYDTTPPEPKYHLAPCRSGMN